MCLLCQHFFEDKLMLAMFNTFISRRKTKKCTWRYFNVQTNDHALTTVKLYWKQRLKLLVDRNVTDNIPENPQSKDGEPFIMQIMPSLHDYLLAKCNSDAFCSIMSSSSKRWSDDILFFSSTNSMKRPKPTNIFILVKVLSCQTLI